MSANLGVAGKAPTAGEPHPNGKKRALASVPYYKLFSHADWLDYAAMAVGAVGAVAHGASLPVFFIFLGNLINVLGSIAQDPHMVREVSKYALYFIYLSLVRFGSGWIEVSMWMYTGDRQATRIRIKYVRALISQDVGFFDTDICTGEVVSGIASDTTLIQDSIGAKAGNLIHFVAQFVAGLVVAFTSVWQLTLLTLAVIPVIMVCGGFYAYSVVGLTTRNQRAYLQAGEVAFEAIAQIRTVQSFVGEERALRLYLNALKTTKKLGIRGGLVKGAGVGSLYGLGFASFALLLWFSGRLIRSGTTTGGEAFATIMNVIASSLSLGQAAPDVATISKGKVAAYTIFEMIRRKPLIDPNADGVKLKQIRGNIELRDIAFSYPSRPDIRVFENFSLLVPAGEVVAVVGASGAGKSTVISMIERFYDPISGEVMLDGHNIKGLQLKWLREQIGLVSQEPALFATSIRENITYGKSGEVHMDEIINAASVACATDFIGMLPEGYSTQVGERGVQLSGGQKQRIAIARAVLKNPAVLLLDEATSALDSESEKSVQEALDRAMLGRTTVVVAHRLSTIKNAKIIAVVQHGKVAELGSHEYLMEQNSIYASLVKIQKTPPAKEAPKNDRRLSRGSYDGSLSRRTFSFGSNVGSLPAIESNIHDLGLHTYEDAVVLPSLRRLINISIDEWPFGLLAAIASFIAGAQTPLFALLITQQLEYFFSPNAAYMKRELNKTSLYLCGVGLLSALAYVGEFYLAGIAGESITLRVRRLMFSAILRNEISWFDQNKSSILASRLSADAPLVKAAVVDRVMSLLQNLGLIVTALIITMKLQWKIAFVMIATLPAIILANLGQIQFVKGFSGDLNMAYMKANMVAGEAVSNIRTVAACSAEDKVMALFSKELREPQKKNFTRGQIGGIGFGLSQFALFSAYALTLWYAAGLIKRGEATFGEAIKCFMVLMITAFGISEALGMVPELLRSTNVLEGVFHILDRKTEINADDDKTEEVDTVSGTIELSHVDFSYPARPDVQIFQDLNVKIRSGYSMALVGASGSGKSSIISLIARFYDPQSGRVLIDGKNIKQLKLKSLRKHIGLVQQEPVLFNTSIYENIRYGKEEATDAEIMDAAKTANAHSFISGLPAGYKTEVGERGLQLSGGQKQRVAIARAVLKNPAILLLDEATSALDLESERLVQEALDKLMQSRTTVLVAHRLSTVRNAHSIAVLDGGALKEQGNHQELSAKQGMYFQLLNLSSADTLI